MASHAYRGDARRAHRWVEGVRRASSAVVVKSLHFIPVLPPPAVIARLTTGPLTPGSITFKMGGRIIVVWHAFEN